MFNGKKIKGVGTTSYFWTIYLFELPFYKCGKNKVFISEYFCIVSLCWFSPTFRGPAPILPYWSNVEHFQIEQKLLRSLKLFAINLIKIVSIANKVLISHAVCITRTQLLISLKYLLNTLLILWFLADIYLSYSYFERLMLFNLPNNLYFYCESTIVLTFEVNKICFC